MFDVTRKVTYRNLPQWYKELREYRPKIPCICAANKIDGKLVVKILMVGNHHIRSDFGLCRVGVGRNDKLRELQSISPSTPTYTESGNAVVLWIRYSYIMTHLIPKLYALKYWISIPG